MLSVSQIHLVFLLNLVSSFLCVHMDMYTYVCRLAGVGSFLSRPGLWDGTQVIRLLNFTAGLSSAILHKQLGHQQKTQFSLTREKGT